MERKCHYCGRLYVPSKDKTCHGCGAPVVSREALAHYPGLFAMSASTVAGSSIYASSCATGAKIHWG